MTNKIHPDNRRKAKAAAIKLLELANQVSQAIDDLEGFVGQERLQAAIEAVGALEETGAAMHQWAKER